MRFGQLKSCYLLQLAVGIVLCGLSAARPCVAASIAFSRTTSAGVPVMVITVDLNDPAVKVTGMLAQNGSGHAERFDSMISRTHPTAAVTGTFFGEGSLLPIGDIVVDGQTVHRGGVGTGFCITPDNDCQFVHPPHRYADMDWSPFDFVCCSGPCLVRHGRVGVYPAAEGFHDHDLLGMATRLAVGRTRHNKLLFVTTRCRIYLSRMARVMRHLGCMDAISLDAGSSLGYYYKSRMLVTPHRKLTNLILIYDDRSRYSRFKSRLFPARSQVTAQNESRGEMASRHLPDTRTDHFSTVHPAVRQENGTWWVR